MKCWNLMGVLTLSSLLPVFAQEPFNGIDMNGLICRQEESGKCVTEKDTQNCMIPLEKLDCSDGEKCCKELSQSKAEVSLLRKKKCCKQDRKCTDVGGKCISKNGKCDTHKNDTLCSKKKCTCCIAGPSTCCDRIATMLTNNFSEMSEEINQTRQEISELKQLVITLSATLKETQKTVNENKEIVANLTTCCNQGVVCPSPFTQVGEECFYRSNLSDSRNWDDAGNYCIELGGDLATPANVTLLREYLRKIEMPIAVWIGGEDRENPGDWRYLNGQEINADDWSTSHGVNQPDNLGREQCLEIRRYFTPPLNNYYCNRHQGFVCQYGAPGCSTGLGCL